MTGVGKSSDPKAAASSSTSSSNLNSHHSSILESMTGPLSKRLRTLHSLQQQQNSNEAVPEYKVNGKGKKSTGNNNNNNNNKETSTSSNNGSTSSSTAATSNTNVNAHRSFDPEQDDEHGEGSRGPPSNSSGAGASSNNGGNNIQTFSVTIETGNSPIKPKKFFQQKSASETVIQEPLFNVIHPLSDVKNNSCLALNRSRRQIKKKKTVYCDQCRVDYDTGLLTIYYYFVLI